MKENKLKGKRVSLGLTQTDCAKMIEKTTDSYAKKERGEFLFTLAEIAALTKGLNLSFDEFNDIFFGSQLQFCNKL